MYKEPIAEKLFRIFNLFAKTAIPTKNIRHMIKSIAINTNKELVGCEIGVARGVNAKRILKVLPIKKLYLVDTYGTWIDEGKKLDYSGYYGVAKKYLYTYRDKTVFVKKDSEEAARYIPNNLDFVYIDASHTAEGVKRDIETYYPKVRSGGYLGGHDFSPGHMGVVKAVLDFVEKNKLELYGSHVDWWIVKKRK